MSHLEKQDTNSYTTELTEIKEKDQQFGSSGNKFYLLNITEAKSV